jgi:hypothetical protein
MKYLLLLSILLITLQLTLSRVIIDLENEGREGSKFIKDLQWVTDKEILESANIPGSNTISEINKEVRLNVSVDPRKIAGGISADVPTMKLTTANGNEIKYSLSQSQTDKCLMLNYQKIENDSGVSCIYSNGFSELIKSNPIKNYKKNISLGNYVIGLTQEGHFDIGIIHSHQISYEDSFHNDFYKSGFKQFENIVIKDFFLTPKVNSSSGSLWILTEDNLILTEYREIYKLDFSTKETFSIKELNLNLAELSQVLSSDSNEYYLILSVGFYKLIKVADKWEVMKTKALLIKGEEIELKNYEATFLYQSNLCVAIKGYGLVIFDDVFNVFEHEHILGLAPVTYTSDLDFILGVFIDNESDENVKEFFIELSINRGADSREFKLNRVFISSQKVKSVKTDTLGHGIVFIMETNTYIVPRSLYSGFASLPVYVYKNAENSTGAIEFVNFYNNAVMFNLIDGSEEKVISLNNKFGDNEAFTCSFKNRGSYSAEITRNYLSLVGEKMQEIITFPVNISIDGKDDKGKDKDKDGKDKKPTDEDGQPTESSDNTVLIIVIVAVSLAVIIGVIVLVLCIRKKRKQQGASGALIGSGNYELSA